MILAAYAVASAMALAFISIFKWNSITRVFSVLHGAAYLGISISALALGKIPTYYFGGRYLFIDRFGIYEIMIASAVFLFAAVYAMPHSKELVQSGELSEKNFKFAYLAFNALLAFVVAAFASNSLALFWIFAELSTASAALLIAVINSRKNIDAALKYVFVNSTAMVFSFIGIILIFLASEHSLGHGTLNWDELAAGSGLFEPTLLAVAFVFLFIGFAAKSGIAPFHTALPHAYSKAPSATGALLSAVVANIGIYGIIRAYSILGGNSARLSISPILIAFGVGSVSLAALSMLQQTSTKKLIAFSSVEHMGLVLIGIGVGTQQALFWVLFYIMAHSLTKALLFFSSGVLHRQYKTNKFEKMPDALKFQPLASAGLIIGSCAIIGMPPFPIFLPKLMLLIQINGVSTWLLAAVLLLLVIASVSFVLLLSKLFSNVSTGEAGQQLKRFEVPFGMKFSIVALIAIIIILGVFLPDALKNFISAIVRELRW
ncbi:MAG: proton-conducting transporter membrane subunit [Candidatus Thermoplasmatota archaeon]|nr:proton-conducting transporter membrane subunit [Candidatus Thermoplasmatota archaeon]